MPKDFNIFEIKKLLKNFTGKNNFSVKKLHDHIIEIENN